MRDLIEPGNLEQMTNAIINLVTDLHSAERLGLLARRRILDTYDFPVVGARYVALYRDLVGAK